MRWKPVINAFAITFGDRWSASGQLYVVQFREAGGPAEVGRSLGEADHVVTGSERDGGGDRAEDCPATGRRVADRGPCAAVVSEPVRGGGSSSVGVPDCHRVVPRGGHVDDEVDVAVSARVTGVVDLPHIAPVGGVGAVEPVGP